MNDIVITIVTCNTDMKSPGEIGSAEIKSGETVVAALRRDDSYEVVLRRLERYADGSTALAVPGFSTEPLRPPLAVSCGEVELSSATILGLAVGQFSLNVDPDYLTSIVFDRQA